FYSIDRERIVKYLENYVAAIKETNGFNCSPLCPNSKECLQFLCEDKELRRLPFNKYLINRIFDGVPSGKGTLRYVLIHSREILTFLLKGNRNKYEDVDKIKHFVKRDVFVKHENVFVKILAEMFANRKVKMIKLP